MSKPKKDILFVSDGGVNWEDVLYTLEKLGSPIYFQDDGGVLYASSEPFTLEEAMAIHDPGVLEEDEEIEVPFDEAPLE